MPESQEKINLVAVDSIERILILNEKNNQRRFEAIEKQMEKLAGTVAKIADSVVEQNIGIIEFRQTTKSLSTQISTNMEDISEIEKKVDLLTTGATGNNIIISMVISSIKVIFSAFVGGAITLFWVIVRNSGGIGP